MFPGALDRRQWLTCAAAPAGPGCARAIPCRSTAPACAGPPGSSWPTSPTGRRARSGSRSSGDEPETVPCGRSGRTSSTPRPPGPVAMPRWPTRPGSRSAECRCPPIAPGIPTLTTPRLVLRPFVFGDLDELAALHAEESFWWYPLRSAMSKDETIGFLERVLARYESDGFGIEALLDRASGTMIGWAGLAVPHFLPEILPGRRGGVAAVGSVARARAGDRGRRGRARVRLHDGRPRAHRQHLRAGERCVRSGHGASGARLLAHRHGPTG